MQMLNRGIRREHLNSKAKYDQITRQVKECSLQDFLHSNYKYFIDMAYYVIKKKDQEFYGGTKFHQQLLPDYIQALGQKYLQLTTSKINQQNKIVLNQLKKLFDKYTQSFNVRMRDQQKINQIHENVFKQINTSANQVEMLESRVNAIVQGKEPLFNPKHFCCLHCIYEGKINFSNLQHKLIAIEDVKRQQLQNAICAALNYPRSALIIIGLNKKLQVAGIPKAKNLGQKTYNKLQHILSQSIKPIIQMEDLNVKYIPILRKQELQETGNCLITIQAINRNKASHYIQVARKGYHTIYLYFIAVNKKESEDDQIHLSESFLAIKQPKGEEIYNTIRVSYLGGIKPKIHYYFGDCQKAREFKETNIQNFNEQIAQFDFSEGKFPLQKIFQQYHTYTDCTYMKFETNSKIFQDYDIIQTIDQELQRQRERYSIKKIHWQQEECIKDQKDKSCKHVFFFLIMHDYHLQTVKNILSSQNKKMSYEFGSVTQVYKIKDLKSTDELNTLKKKDRNFTINLQKCWPEFNESGIQRFYTINSKGIRKVYYQINKKAYQNHAIPSILSFIMHLKLGNCPQYVDIRTVAGPRYELPMKI